jgi:hypothetical protein
MKVITLYIILTLAYQNLYSQKPVSLTKIWTSGEGLKTPESLVYSKYCNCLIVSCINGVPSNKKDGDGYLSKISLEGKIIEEKWVVGLHAPKGSGIYKNSLYVLDIDQIIEIDLKTGKIISKTLVPGATFLNDLYVDKKETLYFTDSDQFKAYSYIKGEITELFKNENLARINGVVKKGKSLYFSSSKSGNVVKYDIKNEASEIIGTEIMTGDGIKPYKDGFLVSAWNGELYFLDKNKTKYLLLDTKAQNLNAADFEYLPALHMIYIPTFNGNSVVAYKIK